MYLTLQYSAGGWMNFCLWRFYKNIQPVADPQHQVLQYHYLGVLYHKLTFITVKF